MAIQPDHLNVTRMVNVGLIGVFLSLAIGYYAAGLYHSLEQELTVEKAVQEKIDATRALKEEQLAAIDSTGEMTLEQAMAEVIAENRP